MGWVKPVVPKPCGRAPWVPHHPAGVLEMLEIFDKHSDTWHLMGTTAGLKQFQRYITLHSLL